MGKYIDLNVKQERQYTNLDQYQTKIVDNSDRSPDFFNISQFPDEFALGKNAFLLTGTNRLKPGSPILIEILDSNGEVIYHETYDYKEGVSRIISVQVYSETNPGQAQIVMLGEARRDADDEPVEARWEGKYNVKWKRKVSVNPNIFNEHQVRFAREPQLTADSITLRELELRYDLENGSNPNDKNIEIVGSNVGPKTTSIIRAKSTGSEKSVLRSEQRSANENNCGEQLAEFMPLERGMVGGTFEITDVTNNTNLDSKLCEQFDIDPDSPLRLRITDVVNRTLCYVTPIGEYADFPEMIALECNGNFRLQFVRQDPVQIINTNRGLCLISLQLKDIKTVAGAVLRARIYARDFDSDDPFTFIGDFELDPQELMIDLNRHLTPREKRTGVFLNQKDIDDFLLPLNNDSKLVHDNRFLLNSVNVQKKLATSGTSEFNLDPVEENQGASEACKVDPIVGGDVDYITEQSDSYQSVIENIDESSPYIGFKQNIFEFFPNLTFEANVNYMLSFKTLLNNFGKKLPNTRFSVFIRYHYGQNSFKEEHIYTYEVKNGIFEYESHSKEFSPKVDGFGDSQLVVKVHNGNWYFSDISLQPSQEPGFSPDFATLYFPLERSLLNELGDLLEFKVDMFDLNNNRVPFDLRTTTGLDVSTCGQVDEYSYTVVPQNIPAIDNCCFVLGTEVIMDDGSIKEIENLTGGDKLKSRVFDYTDLNDDDLLDQETSVEVLDISFDFRDEVVVLNNSIEVTKDHPFIIYDTSEGEWVMEPAENLEVGDKFYTNDDTVVEITSKQVVDDVVREVVNLNVDGDNVYFANNVLTHDKS